MFQGKGVCHSVPMAEPCAHSVDSTISHQMLDYNVGIYNNPLITSAVLHNHTSTGIIIIIHVRAETLARASC